MKLKENGKKEIKRLVNELKRMKKVKAIFLFGSFAKGRALKFSDIDVCVVTDKLKPEERAEIASLGSKKLQISFFYDLPIYIRYEVIKSKLLYLRDKAFLRKIIASTVREYLDFIPLLKRVEEIYW